MADISPRILTVQNSSGSGIGRFANWLAAEGIVVELVSGVTLPESLDAYSGVILLGGGFMPDDDVTGPWLPRERELTREAIDRGIPLLGICLGEQVLAHVSGGEVTESSGETERGSVAIELLEAATEDPLFSAAAEASELISATGSSTTGTGQLRMIQNHKDSVTALPPEAVLLATSEACRVQAFRVGHAAWGVQFHPEADAYRVRGWNESSLAEQGIDRQALAEAAEADAEANQRQSKAIAVQFAALARDYAARVDAAQVDADR